MILILILAATVVRPPEVTREVRQYGPAVSTGTVLGVSAEAGAGVPLTSPIVWEPSAEAAARVLARLEEQERRLQELEQLKRSIGRCRANRLRTPHTSLRT